MSLPPPVVEWAEKGGNIDLEKIRQDALKNAFAGISDDVYGEVVKKQLDKSSQVTKEMLSAVLAWIEESHS